MTSRTDVIGQNGNTGEHYMVEKIARILAGDYADMKLHGKNEGKVKWHLFIPKAIEVLRVVHEED